MFTETLKIIQYIQSTYNNNIYSKEAFKLRWDFNKIFK